MKKIFAVIVIIILIVGVYIYYPRSLIDAIEAKQHETIICTVQYMYNETHEGAIQPDVNTSTYIFNKDTPAYDGLMDIIQKYSYHESITTITNQNKIKNEGCFIVLSINDKTYTLSDSSFANLDGDIVKVGYLGNEKSQQLCKEIAEYCSYQ